MAHRQALRALQSRLAERLTLARTEPRAVSFLAFECMGHGVLVPLASAGEIFPVPALAPLAHTQPWFLGVANLRGLLHGVVDLAAFLGMRAAWDMAAPAGDGGADSARGQARLLAFNPRLGSHCAVLVDRLAGLRSVHQLQPVGDTANGPRAAFAPAVWRDAQGRTWHELDLARLARHAGFLAIAA